MKVAVLDDIRLYYAADNGNLKWYVIEPGSAWAGRLCELGLAHNLDTIWICPGTDISSQAGECLIWDSQDYDVRVKKSEQGKAVFGSVKRVKGNWDEKRLIYFGFPEHDHRWMTDDESWALADVENPITFLEQMTALEEALKPRRVVSGQVQEREFHVRYSPGYSGLDLMKEMVKLHAHVAWVREADLSKLPPHKEPGGFVWKRELDSGERTAKYIHFYDRNGQFIAAATGAELGEGTPVQHVGEFDSKLPGVWRFTCLPNAAYDALPFVVPEAKGWVYTPTIQAMLHLGYLVTIEEALVWPIHHRTLQDWAKLTWEARQSLKAKYGNESPASIMSKMIANRGLGWLDLGARQQEGRTDEPWHRPDWYNMIRSLARYRMTLKLKELADKGYWPVMIVQDNIAYVSNDPNPETAVPGLMIRKSELGGFKSDGTYLLRDVLPLLDSLDPNKIRQEVKKLRKEVYK